MHRQGNTNIPDRDDCKGIIAGCIGCHNTCQVEFFEIIDDVVTTNVLDSELQCDIWPDPRIQFRNGKLCMNATHLKLVRENKFKPASEKVRAGQQKQKSKPKVATK